MTGASQRGHPRLFPPEANCLFAYLELEGVFKFALSLCADRNKKSFRHFEVQQTSYRNVFESSSLFFHNTKKDQITLLVPFVVIKTGLDDMYNGNITLATFGFDFGHGSLLTLCLKVIFRV